MGRGAVHVGANDIDLISYDRLLDMSERKTQSLLLTDERAFLSCLEANRIIYLIFKDPELRSLIESKYKLSPVNEVNGYGFYPVRDSSLKMPPGDNTILCPLPLLPGD